MRSIAGPNAPPASYVRGQLVSSTFVFTPTADGKGDIDGVYVEEDGGLSHRRGARR